MENVSMNMIMSFLREFKADVDRRFELVDQRFEQVDKRFEQVDKRFESIDQRFEQVDQRFEQVDQRFEQIDRRLEIIDQRFEQVDKRFEDADRRFENVYRELHGLRDLIREDKNKLNEIYEARNHVSVSFSRAFVGINLVLSALVSGFVSLFVSR